MALLWTVPVLAVVVAAALLLHRLREVDELAAGMSESLRRLADVRDAVAEVRTGSAAVADRARHLGSRSNTS